MRRTDLKDTKKPKRPRVRVPTCEQITKAQCLLVPNLPNCAPDLAECSCWACGYHHEGFRPYRAHIVAHAAGGETSEPTNYLLLCEVCHREQPDGAGLVSQLLWLVTHPSWLVSMRERWQPTIDAVMAVARERGVSHDTFARWCDEDLPEAAKAFNDPQGWGPGNARPTARAAIVDRFVVWLDAQEAP